VRILIAEENRLLRGALCQTLSREPDFEVVAEADSASSTVQAAIETRPDVVLLGLSVESCQQTVYELLAIDPDFGIIILCFKIEAPRAMRLRDLGVRAYLHKSISLELLKSTIRDVACDDRQTMMLSLPLRGEVALPDILADEHAGPVRERAAVEGCLSDRELQVLECVADAMTNRQIAVRLGITEGTVKRHLRNIFNKLGATSRIDAVNKAPAVRK